MSRAGSGAAASESPPARDPPPAPPRPLVSRGVVDTVRLPLGSALAAIDEGVRRNIKALRKHRTPGWAHPGGRAAWGDDIEGALAECAYAYWRGVFWAPSPLTDAAEGDVCQDHVRSTEHEHGHLLVKVDAVATARHVLMVGGFDTWRVAGWLLAGDAHAERFHRWPDDGKTPVLRAECYAVPQATLHRDLSVLRDP